MSLQFSRHLLIPVWFVAFALLAAFGPRLQVLPSMFLLIVGLVVPTIILALWHDGERLVPVIPRRVVASDRRR